jgi:energy-coupling factor transporter ATP-binding protein EcfA2
MKLRSLELEQFRKFDQPVRLSGFGDRVNVLCGPNEFGKSTILAAIRGLMFERHNSKADPIKRMQNWRGNAAPRLAMEFETGGGLWKIEKRFLSQPMARLTGPDGSRFDNDAAEEELQRLLGFGASGKQGAKPEHMGVWGALWVTQRDSVLQADLSGDLARSTVTSCLDAEVGVLTGTESGQALIRAVRDERGKLLDGNGKPRGRYKEVLTALEAVTARLADLEARSARLSEDATALRSATEKLERESDPAAEQRDQDALAEARRLREAAMLHAERLHSARVEADSARRALDAARAEQQHRELRAARLAAGEAASLAEQHRLQAAREAAEAADEAYAECRSLADAAMAQQTEARAAARRARAVLDLVRQAAGIAALREVIAKAEAEHSKVTELSGRLGAMAISAERLDAIRKAQREHEAALALLAAQATRVSIDLHPDGIGKVGVGGTMLTGAAATLVVVDDTDIAIAGIGRIRISPSIQDREKLDKRLDRARDALATALLAAGAATLAEAEARFAEREAVQRALADSRAALERLAPGDAQAGLAPGLAPLRDHVALLEQQSLEQCQTLAVADLPTLAQARQAAEAADEADMAAAEALQTARAGADIAGDRRAEARGAVARIDATAKAAQADCARLSQETAAAEAQESETDLASRLAKTEAELAQFATALAGLQRAEPAETVEGMQARIERYEQALAQRGLTIRRLRETIAELRARIAQEGGHGLDEQIASAQRERDALQLEHDARLRDTKVLNLLLDTLTNAERETKERYLAPVMRRVTPYLRSLFPGADIACDDALRITGLTRDAGASEDFERLSDGTQEQIAVLSRLAFAEMLIDQGKPAMVILDDALAYADADRMERMFDILTQASAKTQILVLTCREDLFRRLGGNRIELTRIATAAHS